jgi:hypothetical protein
VSEPDIAATALPFSANMRRVEDVDSEDVLSGRLAARWEPFDWLDGTLTYYFQDAEIGGRRISSKRGVLPNVGEYENTKRVLEPNDLKNELLALGRPRLCRADISNRFQQVFRTRSARPDRPADLAGIQL